MDNNDFNNDNWEDDIEPEVVGCDFDACVAGSTHVTIDPCECVGIAEINYDATDNGKLIYVTLKATNLCPGRTLNVGVIVLKKGTCEVKAVKTLQLTPNISGTCKSATLGPICLLVHDNTCGKVEYDIKIIANFAEMCLPVPS